MVEKIEVGTINANKANKAKLAEAGIVEHQPTEAELKAELDKAYASGDWKAIAAAARKIDTAEKAKEKAELDAKRAALDAVKEEVAKVIIRAVKPLVESGKLDVAEGIWFSHDFEEVAPVIRLMKSAPRTAKSGGGGGKKFDISTEEMLSRHGVEEYKDGMTYQVAWESSTNKNWRYAIRQKLLKVEGII